MSDSSKIEERLAQVERELTELKSHVQILEAPKKNWIDDISGSFKKDPEFEEIVRLGKDVCRARPECGACPLHILCPQRGV